MSQPPQPPPKDDQPPAQLPPAQLPPAQLPPLDYETPPMPAPQWPGYVAWAIIILVAGFLIVSNAMPQLRGRGSAVSTAAEQVQLNISVKYALGVHWILPMTPMQPFIDALDKLAQTPADRVRSAIAAGELESGEAAMMRLGYFDGVDSEAIQQDLDALRTVYTADPHALDADQRQRLQDRYGFFGEIAMSYGLPDDDPARARLISICKRVAITLFALVGGALLMGVLGLVLLIVGIVQYFSGRLQLRYAPDRAAGTVYLEMFAVWLLSYVGLSIVVALISGSSSLMWIWVLALSVPLSMLWGKLRGVSWDRMRDGLGWHGGRGALIEIPMGVVGYIGGLPVIIVGFLVTAFLLQFAKASPSHPILAEAANPTFWKVIELYLVASVAAPIIEETMFRGALMHHLRRRWNWLISAALVALLFAAIHPQGWTTIPALSSIAIVLAGIREWRGSLIAPIIAHGLNNGIVVTLLVLMA